MRTHCPETEITTIQTTTSLSQLQKMLVVFALIGCFLALLSLNISFMNRPWVQRRRSLAWAAERGIMMLSILVIIVCRAWRYSVKRSMMQVYAKGSGETVALYQEAFCAKLINRYPREDGRFYHAELDVRWWRLPKWS